MIEAIPNVSEGRDCVTIERISTAIRSVLGVHLLDVSPDADHNRTVFTYVSENAQAITAATLELFDIAVSSIDLRNQQGEHPRAGAVDVVPFVPLAGTTMVECIAIAERVGARVAQRHRIPIYLYEQAARREERRELPVIRRGGFEGFVEKIRDPLWKPDYGPSEVHPTAGVSIIGARIPLIAFNIQLESDRIDIAKTIARTVRASSGGLPLVRAIGVDLKRRGIVQVSMNLLDYRGTSMDRAFATVCAEAKRHGVEVESSEIIGLAPADALDEERARSMKMANFRPSMILERRIEEVMGTGQF